QEQGALLLGCERSDGLRANANHLRMERLAQWLGLVDSRRLPASRSPAPRYLSHSLSPCLPTRQADTRCYCSTTVCGPRQSTRPRDLFEHGHGMDELFAAAEISALSGPRIRLWRSCPKTTSRCRQ